jgi:hypothetical protein
LWHLGLGLSPEGAGDGGTLRVEECFGDEVVPVASGRRLMVLKLHIDPRKHEERLNWRMVAGVRCSLSSGQWRHKERGGSVGVSSSRRTRNPGDSRWVDGCE